MHANKGPPEESLATSSSPAPSDKSVSSVTPSSVPPSTGDGTATKTKFAEGEKVLCFHGPLIYEAKCLRVQVKDKQIKYFIHYAGWNKNWDEWVPESRVLKLNDANISRQKDLQKAHEASLKNKKTKKALERKKGTGGPTGAGSGNTSSGGGDDSRSSTPSSSGPGKRSAASTPTNSSSVRDDSEARRKRSKLDPSVESLQTICSMETCLSGAAQDRDVISRTVDNVIMSSPLIHTNS